MLPRTTIEARVVGDPELRFAPSGVAVCRLRLVANDRKKDPQSGDWVDGDTLWINATAFKQLAENIAESIADKDLVVVTGKLKTDSWQNQEGEKRSAIVLICDTVAADLKFRTIKHGEGQAQRTRQPAADPWSAGPSADQADEPPF